ncbi:MAG: hypothetical protein IK004_04220 [Bacteroidales bacterium]|nr:hypothetical protein [Bacteroidales bacterium]
MKRIVLISIVALFALATMSFTAGDGVTLRLHPNKDKTIMIVSKTSQTTVMKVQGQTMRSTTTLDGRQLLNAKEVSADKIVIETQIEAIKMVNNAMGMTFTYDSDNPQSTSPMIADQANEFDKMIKKPATITYNELGHNANPDNLEMSQLGNVIIELPEQELHVGSQWNYTKTQNVSDVEISINMTCTVTKISKKGVDFSFTGTINSKDVTGNYDGTSTIDIQTGIVTASTVNSNVSMTVSEQGFDIPITITGTTTVTVKEQ